MIKTGEYYTLTMPNKKTLQGSVLVLESSSDSVIVMQNNGVKACFDTGFIRLEKSDGSDASKKQNKLIFDANKKLSIDTKVAIGGRYSVKNATTLPLSAFNGETIVAVKMNGLNNSISFVADESELADLNEYIREVPADAVLNTLIEVVDDVEECINNVPLFVGAVMAGEITATAMVYKNFAYKSGSDDGEAIFLNHLERRGLQAASYTINETPAKYNETGFLYQPKYAWQGRIEICNPSQELVAELSRFITSKMNVNKDGSIHCHSNRLYRTYVRSMQLQLQKVA